MNTYRHINIINISYIYTPYSRTPFYDIVSDCLAPFGHAPMGYTPAHE